MCPLRSRCRLLNGLRSAHSTRWDRHGGAGARRELPATHCTGSFRPRRPKRRAGVRLGVGASLSRWRFTARRARRMIDGLVSSPLCQSPVARCKARCRRDGMADACEVINELVSKPNNKICRPHRCLLDHASIVDLMIVYNNHSPSALERIRPTDVANDRPGIPVPGLVHDASEIRATLGRGRDVAGPQGVSPERRGIEPAAVAYRFTISAAAWVVRRAGWHPPLSFEPCPNATPAEHSPHGAVQRPGRPIG